MALYMEWEDSDLGRTVQRQWHIGESIPKFKGYMVTFHADLDELNCLLSAMGASNGSNPTVIYTKMGGLCDRFRCHDCGKICEEKFNGGDPVYVCRTAKCYLRGTIQRS